MANLNAWQKITRVLPGRPFGNGSDGAYSSATIPTMTKQSCSGAAAQAELTIAGAAFANNDIVLIIQMRGTGVGQYEINKIISGGGSTTLTMKENLHYTYTDSAASQAQVYKIPMYTDVTIATGTWVLDAWDGNVGGILVFAANKTGTPTGSISASSKGFVGPSGVADATGTQGEGTGGAGVSGTGSNGNGGGGGTASGLAGGGAGGGNGAAGTDGEDQQGPGGTGGLADGSADLLDIVMGGAGGAGGGGEEHNTPGTGGKGGGIVFIFCKELLEITGSIVSNAGAGGANSVKSGAGGGGAGGSIIIQAFTATLGTNKIAVNAGAGGGGVGDGGTGGSGAVGRIALHYGDSYTGSTNPTLSATEDSSLVERIGGGNPMFFSGGGVTVG